MSHTVFFYQNDTVWDMVLEVSCTSMDFADHHRLGVRYTSKFLLRGRVALPPVKSA